MKLTNYTIYTYANALANFNSQAYIPAKANFFIQKNINLIKAAASEIEAQRINIAKHYGEPQGDSFTIPPENSAEVEKELADLFQIEQDLDIKQVPIESLGNAEFTTAEMNALMFMIKEEEE